MSKSKKPPVESDVVPVVPAPALVPAPVEKPAVVRPVGWRLRPVAEPLIHRNGEPQHAEAILRPKLCSIDAKQRCAELGGLVAATILL